MSGGRLLLQLEGDAPVYLPSLRSAREGVIQDSCGLAQDDTSGPVLDGSSWVRRYYAMALEPPRFL